VSRTPKATLAAWRKPGERDEDGNRVLHWCAVKGDLDPNASSDETLCEQFITLRVGSKRGVPTCPECRAILRGGGK